MSYFLNGLVTGILFGLWAMLLLLLHLCFAFVMAFSIWCVVKEGSGFWITTVEVVALWMIASFFDALTTTVTNLYTSIVQRMEHG